ncbi:MAG: aminodeoxychorismate/anthranilate synthase component II [Gilvibacter sp.]
MSKILVIDNYDSFVYNLVHYLEEFDCEVTVVRNDQLDIDFPKKFDKILLSPGPGIPEEAGLLMQIIQQYGATKSILGVCLGQQAIAQVYGGSIINLEQVFHGIATPVTLTVLDEHLFKGLEATFEVGRYHSWVVNPADLPESLEITAKDKDNNIMALRHREYDVRGVQFHPESVLTPHGKTMIKNWITS